MIERTFTLVAIVFLPLDDVHYPRGQSRRSMHMMAFVDLWAELILHLVHVSHVEVRGYAPPHDQTYGEGSSEDCTFPALPSHSKSIQTKVGRCHSPYVGIYVGR